MSERQNVLDVKLKYYISSQDELKEKHFEIFKCVSQLHKDKIENGLNLDYKNTLSKIKLRTSVNEWHLPSNIHLSNKFNPKLILENDEIINQQINFLSNVYYDYKIQSNILIRIGVNENFKFLPAIEKIHIDGVANDYLSLFLSMNSYLNRLNVISRNYTDSQIKKVTSIRNHQSLNYAFVYTSPKYLPAFWDFILKDKVALNKLASKTELRIWDNNIYENDNQVLYNIKSNKTVLADNVYKKPTQLYSHNLIPYLNNSSEYSKINFSRVYIDEEKTISLEQVIGIKQKLDVKHCLSIISKTEIELTEIEIKTLDIIGILSEYKPNDYEHLDIKLPNKLYKWITIKELFTSSDEHFLIEASQQLHEDFHPISNNFGIKELSSENLILRTTPVNTHSNDDIILFFESKSKFIAFKIDHLNYIEIEEQIIDKIQQYNFHEVSSIVKIFPQDNPIYISNEYELYKVVEANKILYKNNWKTNSEVIDFLFTLVSNDRIERKWFENIINRWDENKIIENLNENIGETPPEWKSHQSVKNDNTKSDFLTEVENFIESMKEVEDIYDADKIEDLKSILAEFKNHPKEKQLTFNLLAKLKLCKKLSLNYDRNWEFNSIESGNEKFLIHSARGSFAYIHPNEILKMKDDGYKMAIDYGTKDIRIYYSHTEIIALYQNYLMLYQGSPNEEDILSICKNSMGKEKFHFLIADREKQVGEGLAIFKFLNNETYD